MEMHRPAAASGWRAAMCEIDLLEWMNRARRCDIAVGDEVLPEERDTRGGDSEHWPALIDPVG